MKHKFWLKAALVLSTFIGIVSCCCLYHIYTVNNVEILVPVAKLPENKTIADKALSVGDKIEEANIDLQPRKKGSIGQYVITDANELIGKYVVRDYYPEEEFTANSLSLNYPKKLSEKIYYSGVTMSTSLKQTSNSEVRPNDFVKVIITLNKKKDDNDQITDEMSLDGLLPDEGKVLVASKYLSAVRVVGVYESDGTDTDAKRTSKGANTKTPVSPSMITFDPNPIQEALLMYAKYNGSIDLIILPEQEQETYRKLWGIDNDGNINKDIDLNAVESEVASLNDIPTSEQTKSIGTMPKDEGKEIAKQEIIDSIESSKDTQKAVDQASKDSNNSNSTQQAKADYVEK